ncbi:uncharacterized protein LOC134769736 [Penaeus indicus]|uniref:uncharacterized protein LOC134769736 n=1 Tax=Penaeus indicus TaxID=29960 RepID=UPI00300C21D6
MHFRMGMRVGVFSAAALCLFDVGHALFFIPTTAGTFTVVGAAAIPHAIVYILGGLAAVQGAAWLGYLAGEKSRIRNEEEEEAKEKPKRSIEPENLILLAVHELDPFGCVKKMLCHIEAADINNRTQQEELLLRTLNGYTFLTSIELPSSKDSEGEGAEDAAALCDQLFSKCPLGRGLLREILNMTWRYVIPFDVGLSLDSA